MKCAAVILTLISFITLQTATKEERLGKRQESRRGQVFRFFSFAKIEPDICIREIHLLQIQVGFCNDESRLVNLAFTVVTKEL